MNTLILGWIANILFLYGVYAIGNKKIIGFYTNSLGNALYLWQAIIRSNDPLLWLSVGLIILNIKGIMKWRRDEKKISKIKQYSKHRLYD